jgi:hypothetical protein
MESTGINHDRFIYPHPAGSKPMPDFAAIRARVQKMADIGPAFESTAKRREAKASAAEAEGNLITARDKRYMAAIHYGAAEWPYGSLASPGAPRPAAASSGPGLAIRNQACANDRADS